MKPLSFCFCLALSLFREASAQPVDPFAGGIAIKNSTPSHSLVTLGELTLKPGKLPTVVEQLQDAWSVAAPAKWAVIKEDAKKDSNLPDDVLVNRLYLDIAGRKPNSEEVRRYVESKDAQKLDKLIEKLLKEQSLPTLIFGPGSSEALVSGTLHLAEARPLDALVLVATAAGCYLDPVHSLATTPEDARIIGYTFVPDPGRVVYSVPLNGEATATEELARVGVDLADKDGNVIISEVLPGSPAERIKIVKPGDRILRVGEEGKEDVEVTGMPLEKVAELIRGKPGTVVRLCLLSENTGGAAITHLVSMTREHLSPQLPMGVMRLEPSGGLVVTGSGTISGGTTRMTNSDPAPQSGYTGRTVPNVAVVQDGNVTGRFTLGGNITPSANQLSAPPPGTSSVATQPSAMTTTFAAGKPHPNPNLPLASSAAPAGDAMSVRIYALGPILSGNETERREKEINFLKLVNDAIDLAETGTRPEPKLFLHSESRVLVARATPRQHEVIDQAVVALKEIDKLVTPSKENEIRQTSPKSP